MKVTLNSTNGEKTAKPFDVFLNVKPMLQISENKLIVSFSQSKVEGENANDNIDYIGLKRGAIVIDKPSLFETIAEFEGYAKSELKKHIETLKLSSINSITI